MSPATQRFDIDVAFPCDIDLQWYLVPKQWIRMLVASTQIQKIRQTLESEYGASIPASISLLDKNQLKKFN